MFDGISHPAMLGGCKHITTGLPTFSTPKAPCPAIMTVLPRATFPLHPRTGRYHEKNAIEINIWRFSKMGYPKKTQASIVKWSNVG
jgi:hypothetical protein